MKKALIAMLALTLVLTLMPSLSLAGEDTLHIISRNLGKATGNDNDVLRAIEEATGLSINWELWPTDQYPQNCQLLIASGDYPDAMEIWWTTFPNEFIELIEDGVIQPLDALIDEYGPNIRAVRDESVFYRYADGDVYGVPNRNMEDLNCNCVMVRKDWMDKLGLSMPTSSDEYYDMLKAFAENAELLTGNPNSFMGHGACTTYFDNCLMEYVLSENGMQKGWNEVEGDLVYYVNMPGYKNALLTLRRFYQDGLLEPEYLLMNRDQFMEKLYTNIYGGLGYSTDNLDPNITGWTRIFYETNPDAELAVMMPFADENGQTHMRTIGQTMQTVVFADSPNADKVVRLLNFLASDEGAVLTQYGIEGKHWVYDEDGNRVSLLTTDEEKGMSGVGSYDWLLRPSYFALAFSSQYDEVRAELKSHVEPTLVLPVAPAYMDYGTALNKLVSEAKASLIVTEDVDFDAVFDQFLKNWNEQGGELWTQEMNAMYREMASGS